MNCNKHTHTHTHTRYSFKITFVVQVMESFSKKHIQVTPKNILLNNSPLFTKNKQTKT